MTPAASTSTSTSVPGRLNPVIAQLDAGNPAFIAFSTVENGAAIELARSKFDGVLYEMEHGPYDIRALKDAMQYMFDPRAIADRGTVAPSVAPFVRIPPNGGEMNQSFAKQVLDCGAYGVIWPHVDTVEEATNAVSACRYSGPSSSDAPKGIRGDGPSAARRYWGLTQQEYYDRADVWPAAPDGEIMVVIMVESRKAVQNLPRMLSEVPGIGAVLIGEGDLSQDLGYPRDYEHPEVKAAIADIVDVCKGHGTVLGHPHVTPANVEELLERGFRLLASRPGKDFTTLNAGLAASGRR